MEFGAVEVVCLLQDPEDMVLEEVDSDWDADQKEQTSAPPVSACEGPMPEPPGVSLLQALPSLMPQVLAMQEQQEDAETQTERWTPLVESIKKEAEQSAMASLEER